MVFQEMTAELNYIFLNILTGYKAQYNVSMSVVTDEIILRQR